MRVALALIVVILVAVAVTVVSRGGKNHPKFKSTDEFIQYMAGEAVSDADKENHVHLDYSVDSIQQVETILGQLHDQYVSNPNSVSAKGLGAAYGAYVGETIRRSEPNVKWQRDDAVGGEKSYPLIWAAGHSYPMAWCYHRIVNGPGDNVWIKYLALKRKGSSKLSDAFPNALIVTRKK